MNTTHTPGPWEIQDLGTKPGYPDWHTFAIRDSTSNVCLAVVGNLDRYFEKNNKDNARLIAAAPELLEAAELMVKQVDLKKYHVKKDFSFLVAHAQLVKMIAKARGEI